MVRLETVQKLTEWKTIRGVCTYQGADDPTYTMYVVGDANLYLSLGMRIRVTQTTNKYFILTKIGTYDSGNNRTLLTMYGGTDYDLANATIINPSYSVVKAPFGFPLQEEKWTVLVTNTSLIQHANVTENVWYNSGVFISVPIGNWDLGYRVSTLPYSENSRQLQAHTTLSTTTNSQTDSGFTCQTGFCHATPTAIWVQDTLYTSKRVSLTSKTTYNLLSMMNNTSAGSSARYLQLYNNVVPCNLFARCCYL